MTNEAVKADGAPKKRKRMFGRFSRVVIVILLLGVGGVVGFKQFWWTLEMGEGPAGPAVALEPFETVWSDRRVVLLGLGDSVTDGFGASPGKSYFELLEKSPADEWEEMRGRSLSVVYPNLTVSNKSQSGSDSLQHVELQLSVLPVHDAEVMGIVVMTTGGNDIIHDYGRRPPREGAMYGATWEEAEPWIANFETRLTGMIETVTAKFPGGCHIFLANIYDPTDGTGGAWHLGFPTWPDAMRIHGAYNEVIERVADRFEQVHLVDMHGVMLGHGIHCRKFWMGNYDWGDASFWYLPIIEDPNDRGYDAIRRVFLNRMAAVLGPKAEVHPAAR